MPATGGRRVHDEIPWHGQLGRCRAEQPQSSRALLKFRVLIVQKYNLATVNII